MMARPFEDFYRKWKEEGKKEGKEVGKEEGKKEGKKEAVTLLLKSGMPIYEIAERLDMTVSQVKALTEKESIKT